MLLTNLFYIFSTLIIISSIGVISSKNPVYSVLYLILAFLNSAILFLFLNAEFLAMLLIVVYVGAVAVLFLFVVMMLNIRQEEQKLNLQKYTPFTLFILAIVFYFIETMFRNNFKFKLSLNLIPLATLSSQALPTLLFSGGWGLLLGLYYLFINNQD